jgi:hypothetical protein
MGFYQVPASIQQGLMIHVAWYCAAGTVVASHRSKVSDDDDGEAAGFYIPCLRPSNALMLAFWATEHP